MHGAGRAAGRQAICYYFAGGGLVARIASVSEGTSGRGGGGGGGGGGDVVLHVHYAPPPPLAYYLSLKLYFVL